MLDRSVPEGGTQGIAVATVPEPAALSLLGLGAALLLRRLPRGRVDHFPRRT